VIDEHDVRGMLQRRASAISSMPTDPDVAVRRARLRLTRTGIVGTVTAVFLVVGLISGIRILDLSKETSPALPSESSILHEGEVLELGSNNTLVATDTATRGQRTLAQCTECAGIRQFAASAGGRWIAYDAIFCLATCGEDVYPGAGIWVVGAAGPPVHVTTDLFPGKWAWSPTAEQLALAVGGGKGSELFLLDPATGERTSIVTTEGAIPALAWSPDGSTIAYAAGKPSEPSGNFIVHPGADPERIGGPYIVPLCCVEVTRGIESLVWSPDGTRLVVSTQSEGVTVVWIDGSGERTVLDRQPAGIAWSPDGREIAFADGHDVGIVAALVWSPDGTLVAFSGSVGTWYAVPADGSGTTERIDRLEVEQWIQG
jgi:hypothetical protein